MNSESFWYAMPGGSGKILTRTTPKRGSRTSAPKQVKGRCSPSAELMADERRALDDKRNAKAEKLLGFNPFAIGNELEQWRKGIAWHGMPDLKRRLVRAKFNLPMLILHLEAMTARLKRG